MLDLPTVARGDLFSAIGDHEHVLFFHDPDVGLKGIIAIHDTSLGPALGGTRMAPYPDLEAALFDALRLARGMTWKAVAADLDVGGGKAVLIGDPEKDRSPELFRAFGRQVHALGGRFYTGTDMGTQPEDFAYAYQETPYLVGLPEAYGGGGDSSVTTADGVVGAIRVTLEFLDGDGDLKDRTFVVQGLGKVGLKVAHRLLEAGGRLIVADPSAERVDAFRRLAESFGKTFQIVSPEAIYDAEADVFVPCAYGGVITEAVARRLRVRAIVGSANQPLAHPGIAETLKAQNVLFAPDYLANAGGLIQVADELFGPNPKRVEQKLSVVLETLRFVYRRSDAEGLTTVEAAERLVRERWERRKRLNVRYRPDVPPKWRFRR
ncbi:Glu/Leu/Phe/Val dehydrogenase dimerization domain-containing protein [Hydrogenibacillus sp. N12]|uniref:Leucine dehydrogenase n=1 Tax=Hydrogenibacillus schlegelii TaxID=1484 RepID=A0A947CXX5_HYDSH|nr:Glu/Leu/Phe/Val dehydrogenase dimerization domain-containing protein [Hydrogenibacillus sp. N12]MBT9281880.1 leucine dehydrogenase [Hydrogenibacillus schlegelii]QZA31977.1 leucine dehydrogenase [Hydrogenibacillus sp. N12]